MRTSPEQRRPIMVSGIERDGDGPGQFSFQDVAERVAHEKRRGVRTGAEFLSDVVDTVRFRTMKVASEHLGKQSADTVVPKIFVDDARTSGTNDMKPRTVREGRKRVDNPSLRAKGDEFWRDVIAIHVPVRRGELTGDAFVEITVVHVAIFLFGEFDPEKETRTLKMKPEGVVNVSVEIENYRAVHVDSPAVKLRNLSEA